MRATDTPPCFVCGQPAEFGDRVNAGEHRGQQVVVHAADCWPRFQAEREGLMDMLARQFERSRVGGGG